MANEVQHILKGFLSSEIKYKEVIQYWKKRILNELDNSSNYSEWLNNKTIDGKLIMDGNPIFSLIDTNSSKAIRIVQDEPRSKNPYMQCWVESFDSKSSNISVLVIALELSNKTLIDSLILIKKWFIDYNKSNFAILIERINKKYEKYYTKSYEEIRLEAHLELKKINTLTPKFYTDNKNISIPAIKSAYLLLNNWDKTYSKQISHIDPELGSRLNACVNGLYGIITEGGNIRFIRSKNDFQIRSKDSITSVKKYYFNTHSFYAVFTQLCGELNKANESLIMNTDDFEKVIH